MEEYKKALARLNPAQRTAVETIEGPLLVIAGPGTGKTELLGVRVAHILATADTSPQNILCLTFTNKAAQNMQERLTRLIGSAAQGVTVRTFHSFAADIINRYPEHFFNGARLSIAPEATQLEIVSSVLDDLPADHPLSLRFAGQYTLIKDVREAINLTKDAGLSAAQLRTLIKSNLDYLNTIGPRMSKLGSIRVSPKAAAQFIELTNSLPHQKKTSAFQLFRPLNEIIVSSLEQAVEEAEESGKNTALSAWKARWVQSVDGEYGLHNERRRNEWWLGVADAYEHYEQQLKRRGYFDYADMLLSVNQKLEKEAELQSAIQEQFLYILIDEFQDTNPAQLQLAYLVGNHPVHEGKPNIMAVGDDDQSIFKFQGAQLSNMLNFRRLYPSAKIVVLTENYRSSQPILNTAETIIEHAAYRLVREIPEIEKSLHAQQTNASSTIFHMPFASQAAEYAELAKHITGAHSRGESTAVLARGHSSLRQMAALLFRQGIPLRYEQTNDIFEKPAVQLIARILRLLAALEDGDEPLASQTLAGILPHPLWQIPPKALWQFAVKQRQSKDWYRALLESSQKDLHYVGVFISELASMNASEPFSYVFEAILGLRPLRTTLSPLKAYYIDQHELKQEYVETLSAIGVLRSVVSEYSHHTHAKLRDFVRFIELLENNQQILADSYTLQTGDNFVSLHTVHTAKGLEFDSVFVLDANQREWSPNLRGRLPPANVPLRRAEDDTDDYARLMYVAATRAKRNLIVGSYRTSVKGDALLASPLIDGLDTKPAPEPTPEELVASMEAQLGWPRLEPHSERLILQPLLENYTMSVTHLINFLDVSGGGPEYFLARNILRLPSVKSPSLSFGTALHAALEEAQRLTNAGSFAVSKVQHHFRERLGQESLDSTQFKKQLRRGELLLKQLFKPGEGGLSLQPGDRPEYQVDNLACGPALLNGKLDLLHQTESELVISDYKTGRPLSSLNARSGDAAIKAWKHRTQLVFYALLAQLDPHIKQSSPPICQMIYVESATRKDFVKSLSPTEDEITRLATLIQHVWQKIKSLDLPDVSGYSPDIEGIRAFETDLLK